MSDPSHALQVAQYGQLTAAGGISGVGTRVYDDVPPNATFPYIVIGDGQVVGDDNSCNDASEVFSQVHVWSRAVGYTQAKQIAAEVRARLAVTPALAGFTVTVIEFVRSLPLRDPDGKTRHIVVEFRYLITHN